MRPAIGALMVLAPLGLQTSPIEVPPPVDAFPAYLWRLDHRDEPLPQQLLNATGGSHVERAGTAAWLVERGAPFYVGHGPGRNTLHPERDSLEVRFPLARFGATRDEGELVRTPCLSDPQTRADLRAALAASLAPDDRVAADFVSLGDEVSITPYGDPIDFCHSAHCDAAFQRWIAGGGGERYGLSPGARRCSTDALLSSPTPRKLGAWLGGRAFQRAVLSDLLLELAEHSRALRPGLAVGVLGLVGETAFGGVDLEAVAAALEVLEPYRVADAVERCASLRALGRGPATILETIFLDQQDPDSLRAHLRGLVGAPVDGVVVWCDRDLTSAPELRVVLEQELTSLRRARAAQPERDRDPRGVALLHSDDSLAHAFLREARGDRLGWTRRLAGLQEREGHHEVRRREALEQLRQAGEHPGSIPLDAVDGALVARFGRLVAVDLTVVSDAELDRLRAFVAAGGELEVRGPFAELRPDGTRRARSETAGGLVASSVDRSNP
ncbi:hypothetical protein [Engelhardtia mirabilis]|uniref:Uncharacterized protein n=1 Tax=Engelhardtia mirabilis TaxID=2528011 RepID=A0A518BJX6_9BACT|nr:hypothetical protein Pla133_23560 [Planctomycetes bacterium Pla133]QDV01603.1 hypothetical protein Pla86_23550 [Planctomycetes bacterium Pla86]